MIYMEKSESEILFCQKKRVSLVDQLVKNALAIWETWVQSVDWEDPHYSGLENSVDCIVHGVTKSRTRLSDFHFTSPHYLIWSLWDTVRKLMKRNHRTLVPRSYKLLSNARKRNRHVRRRCLACAPQGWLSLRGDQAGRPGPTQCPSFYLHGWAILSCFFA